MQKNRPIINHIPQINNADEYKGSGVALRAMGKSISKEFDKAIKDSFVYGTSFIMFSAKGEFKAMNPGDICKWSEGYLKEVKNAE